eukprot:6208390-Pleurochrysis_carterae.AAC.4
MRNVCRFRAAPCDGLVNSGAPLFKRRARRRREAMAVHLQTQHGFKTTRRRVRGSCLLHAKRERAWFDETEAASGAPSARRDTSRLVASTLWACPWPRGRVCARRLLCQEGHHGRDREEQRIESSVERRLCRPTRGARRRRAVETVLARRHVPARSPHPARSSGSERTGDGINGQTSAESGRNSTREHTGR